MPPSARSLAILSCLAVVVGPTTSWAKALHGTIVAVHDADRLVVAHEFGTYDLTLIGVVAPRGTEPFAVEARQLVERLALGRFCRVYIEGREADGVMESLLTCDGVDVGAEVVRAGFADRRLNDFYKPATDGGPDALTAARLEARSAGRGMWFRADATALAEAQAVWAQAEVLGANGEVDRNVSKLSGGDSECAAAQSPLDPNRIYMSCNRASGTGMLGAFSVDGGLTWSYTDPVDKTVADGDANQGEGACCDPTLAWDSFGNLYLTYIDDSLGAIVTILSTDNGLTFAPLARFTGSIDQPTIVAADVTGGGVDVWVVWNQSGAMVARGAHATGLGAVGAFHASNQAISGASGCTFGDIAIAPSGVVVQVCGPSSGQGPATLEVNIDPDGLGATAFGSTASTVATNVGGFDFIPAQNSRSVDAESGLAFDAKAGSPSFGRLYLVYTDEVVNESHDMDIMVRTSADNGATWSAPIRVNDDATTRSQFLPKIAADPVSGNVAVCWHDARNSGSNTAAEMYCSTAVPTAGTPVFGANVLVSDGASTSNGGGVEFGDYMGLTFLNGVVHPVWGDTSNSTGDNPNTTSNFDGYSDRVVVDTLEAIFADGFETGNTSAWSGVVP